MTGTKLNPQVLARQVFLHHVLVQARHGDGGEGAGEELLPEEALVRGVVEVPDAGHRTLSDDSAEALEIEPQGVADEDDGQDDGADHAQGLQHVHPDQGLDSAPEGVEPDDAHRQQDVDEERYAQRTE